MKKYIILFIALALVSCKSNTQLPIIVTESGKVQGVMVDDSIIVYRGIPYAQAPVGELRWREPQRKSPWDGVLKADTFSAAAVQASHDASNPYTAEFFFNGDPEFSEDCLYLNIWTPANPNDTQLPVAVWVHGGGFTGGWGHEIEMDGNAWADRGVILVTFNYRLGVFGFLSHPLLSAEAGRQSGNYGLLDQIAALRWVQDNISNFGGDPSNVTLFGQSAGARSIENLIMSPLTDGLFSKVILMSGAGAPQNMTPTDNAGIEERTLAVFNEAGFDSLDEMRAASTEAIFDLQPKLTTSIVSDSYVNVETFTSAAERGAVKDIPYLVGYTTNDLGNRYLGITRFADLRAKAGKPVYLYEFTRQLADDDSHPHPMKGAFHSSELWFVFNTLDRSDRPFGPQDYELSEKMVDAWTNFAKVSDPDPDSIIGWNQYDGSNRMIF